MQKRDLFIPGLVLILASFMSWRLFTTHWTTGKNFYLFAPIVVIEWVCFFLILIRSWLAFRRPR